MKSKTKTVSDTNQTQTQAPPSWTAPGLSQAAQMVTARLGSIPTSHYSGDMVAAMNAGDLARIQQAWGATAANAGGLATQMQGMLPQLQTGTLDWTTGLPSTDYTLAPRQDLDAVINASIDPVQRMLMEQILPSITNSALSSGAYSGDRAMGVLPTDAIRNATESMQNIAAQLGYEDYQNYENRRLAAYQATTAAAQGNYGLETSRQGLEAQDLLARMGLMPDYVNAILHTQASQGDLLKMAADLGVQQRQAQIDNALKQDQYASYSPFMGLDQATQLLTALSGGWGTQNMTGHSTSTQTQSQPIAGQLIQGALGLGMAAAGMPGGLGGIFGGGSPATQGASSMFQFNPAQPFGAGYSM